MNSTRMLAARRAAEIEPFQVMDVLARAQALEAAGRRVVHMEIGEPDFTAPEEVVEAGVRALRDGRTAYTATLGLPALREAIAAHYARCFGAAPDPARVVVTAGASGGLLLALALYVDPGDEVLVPDPGYPGYRQFVRAFEGVPRPLALAAQSDFQPTLDGVRRAWGARTKAMLLGSPSNPTGTVADAAELARIAQFVAEHDGVLIADEIYQGLVYGAPPATALGLPGEVVLVNSFSKYFCMTGWRLGWVVLPPARVRDFEKLAQHFFICAPSAAQHAALAAFTPRTLAVLEERRAQFERRRDLLLPALRRAGLEVPAPPRGAFYVYADCTPFGGNARRFALELLEQEGVAATPGLDFGANGTAHCLRFAYTRSLADLEEGAARIARFCAGR
ncbi:MAG: aminotransferase class I/II-fold pyridoxal phosphate-dependent enzyme [Betaproteobacteria bacterium]|nr:aminotransferase class I/II-fold pyridoxal phosphate-dependent enzyme [Betaproteobacteria bacterium]